MYAMITLLAVPMRACPSDKAEMVNQLLEGDTLEVLQRDEKWSLLRNDFDGYEGWVDNKQYLLMETRPEPMLLPSGRRPSEEAMALLGAPYLWGGRSPYGIDCSGLTQVCFRKCGVALLRDASQQAQQGVAVAGVAEAKQDDLCFFQNEDGRIVHVGIYLGDNRIIHASGEVRIDRLDATGIFNESIGEYTHRLHAIRRIQ